LGDGNGLKLVNDAFGHQAGDELLTRLGAILKEVCRQEDVVARVGGDEFVIILPGVDCDEAKKVIRRIRQRCSAAPSEPFKPSIALGAATKQYKEQSIQMVYRQAEERMYAVKLSESRGIRSDIIRSIQRTLARHTHETEEHGNRLRILMSAVGAKLQLHAYEINGLELLADLHDIGKIAVPVHILEKPEGLLYDEWKLIKKHCEIGYRIAVFSPVLVSIADAILSHHEHWDGKGYPQGLSREMIPLSARILAIADTYDILTHDRPYRKAISPDGALNEIIRCSGTQFDPMLVDVFVEVLRERAGEHRRAEGE
jgi:diguanylate cyclase (GGDEF)-like protein